MVNTKLKNIFVAKKEADKKLSAMSPKERTKLERKWDVEHAYYSSALEGSKVDRGDIEQLAQDLK